MTETILPSPTPGFSSGSGTAEPLTLYRYDPFTVWPDIFGSALDRAVGHPLSLPRLVEPDVQPDVEGDSAEPLVRVDRIPGVVDLAAYRAVGWPGAVERSLVRTDVADRLPAGFGLAVFDAWRPIALQRAIYDAAYADPTLPPGFVSEPSTDPRTPPPHATGGTVDLTLTYRGQPLALGTLFDDFSPVAHADALEGTGTLAERLRRLLFEQMARAGFVVIACEWWHFEFGTRRWAAITGGAPRYRAVAADKHSPSTPHTSAA